MGKRKVLAIAGVLVVIALLLAITALNRRGGKAEAVRTIKAAEGDIEAYLSTNATIKSRNARNYFSALQLPVKSVKVKAGDPVTEGQVMLEYDVYELEIAVKQARLQYNNAVLQKDELLRQKEQQGSFQAISDEKIKLMDNSIALARLALDAAVSKYEKYRKGITADFDGVVTMVNAAEGQLSNAVQPAITVQQLNNLKAVMSLGRFDAPAVKLGQKASLKYGGRVYGGVVSFIGPAASETVTMTGKEAGVPVDIDILDEDKELKVDFDVNVDILTGSAKNTVKVPAECIEYEKNGDAFLYRVEAGKARRIHIEPGIQSDTEVQVVSGVSAGDTIILNPGMGIKDGTPVKTGELQ